MRPESVGKLLAIALDIATSLKDISTSLHHARLGLDKINDTLTAQTTEIIRLKAKLRKEKQDD